MAITVSRFVKEYIPYIVKYDFDIIPVMMGNPGISKTSQLHQLCQAYNWGLIPVHLALRPIESLSGIPEIIKKDNLILTEWSIPEIISQTYKLADKHEKVILFFDDIHLADKTRQSYFFELATERSISGHKLPDNVKIVCAGNPTSKAGAKTFLSAIVNRFTFVDVELSPEEWLKWAASNKNNENNLPKITVDEEKLKYLKNIKIHPLIQGFIQNRTELLSMPEQTQPYATPRSWYYMSEWLKIFELKYGNVQNWAKYQNDLITIAKGTIGNVASDFYTFVNYLYDVNIDEVMKNPELILKYNAEKRVALLYLAYTLLAEKKYKKYMLVWLDFAYNILGNNGEAPHFAGVLINMYLDDFIQMNDKRIKKYVLTKNIKSVKDVNDIFDKYIDNVWSVV